jgi:hypothetical protein
MKKARIKWDININVEIVVAWINDFDVLDTIEVFIEEEQISQYFYVDVVEFEMDYSNKTTTRLILKPIIPSKLK